MPIGNDPDRAYTATLASAGTVLTVAGSPYLFGPFSMETFAGVQLIIDRTDDGSSGTLAATLEFADPATGENESILDGAGSAVAINGFAAGENDRRLLQVHPTAGPANADDADGVLAQGNNTYYRQPMPAEFYVEMTVATDSSTLGATLGFLH